VSFAAITLCVASQRMFIFVCCLFRHRLSPEIFGYTLLCWLNNKFSPIKNHRKSIRNSAHINHYQEKIDSEFRRTEYSAKFNRLISTVVACIADDDDDDNNNNNNNIMLGKRTSNEDACWT
jgi:hypothetical protein